MIKEYGNKNVLSRDFVNPFGLTELFDTVNSPGFIVIVNSVLAVCVWLRLSCRSVFQAIHTFGEC